MPPPPLPTINTVDKSKTVIKLKVTKNFNLYGELEGDTLFINMMNVQERAKFDSHKIDRDTSTNIFADSTMILTIWKDNGILYTYSIYNQENKYIRKNGKVYKNTYQLNEVDITDEFIMDIKLLYNILNIKSKKKRIKQLKQFEKSTQIKSLRQKCGELINNNIKYGNNLGKPIL